MNEISSVERAEYLLKQAMTSLQTDRSVAWRCLTDAATLLSSEAEAQADCADSAYNFRPGGLARWQARRTLNYIEDNLGAYVAARRIEQAKRLMLATRDPLSHIALACGFSDQPHFNKLFRRRVGMSPGIWRRRFA
jgi:methylphosphotriester-DNA--protein-cysteine methyltransferase